MFRFVVNIVNLLSCNVPLVPVSLFNLRLWIMVLLKKFLYLCTTLLVITVRMWPCANQVSLENIVICLILLFMIIIFYCKTRGKTNPKMQENAFQSSKSKNFRGSMCSHSHTPVTPLNFEHPPRAKSENPSLLPRFAGIFNHKFSGIWLPRWYIFHCLLKLFWEWRHFECMSTLNVNVALLWQTWST